MTLFDTYVKLLEQIKAQYGGQLIKGEHTADYTYYCGTIKVGIIRTARNGNIRATVQTYDAYLCDGSFLSGSAMDSFKEYIEAVQTFYALSQQFVTQIKEP